jgi:DNA modification methylase
VKRSLLPLGVADQGKTIIPINQLHGWDKNPRKIDNKAFSLLKKKIQRWGQFKPVLITPDNEVIGGNMRLKAYKELGIEDVWVSVVEPKSEAEKIEIAIADNESSGEWDVPKLEELAVEFKDDINLDDYKIDLDGKWWGSFLPEEEVIEDEAPEVDEDNVVSVLGEVYQLGRHRLMCGDSTKIEDVEKLMDGKKADMVFTDPPYGVDYSSRVDKDKKKPWGGIINDDLEGEKLREFLYDSCFLLEKPKYTCCNWQSVMDFILALGKPNSFIVWDKGSIGLGAGYRNQHEIILFYGTLNHNSESNVWSIKRDSTSGYNHPTQKPVAIPARAIKNSSDKNGLVLDVFLGSGSTLIACEQTNRTCYGMELDPKYCDVIRKRYAKFIGKEDTWQEVTSLISR